MIVSCPVCFSAEDINFSYFDGYSDMRYLCNQKHTTRVEGFLLRLTPIVVTVRFT